MDHFPPLNLTQHPTDAMIKTSIINGSSALDEKEKQAYDDYLAYLGYELGLLDTAKADGRAEGSCPGYWIGDK